jgi:hypothetical protein
MVRHIKAERHPYGAISRLHSWPMLADCSWTSTNKAHSAGGSSSSSQPIAGLTSHSLAEAKHFARRKGSSRRRHLPNYRPRPRNRSPRSVDRRRTRRTQPPAEFSLPKSLLQREGVKSLIRWKKGTSSGKAQVPKGRSRVREQQSSRNDSSRKRGSSRRGRLKKGSRVGLPN